MRRTAPPEPVPAWLRAAAAWGWRLLVIAAAVVVLALLVERLAGVVVPAAVAVLLATALAPLVAALRARGWSRTWAAVAVFAGGLAALALVIGGLVAQVIDQSDQLSLNVRGGIDEVERWLVEGPVGLSPDTVADLRARVGGELGGSGQQVVSGASAAFEVVAGIVIVLFVTFFLLRDGDIAWRGLLALAPAGHRDEAERLGRESWATVGAFLRGTAVVGLIDAVLIAGALLLLDVPLVLPLAVLTFAAAFIPFVGAAIAGGVAALVALASGGFAVALLVVGASIAVQQIEGSLIYPLVMSRAVRLHPVAVLLSVVAGAAIAGIIGAFLAVPLVAVATVVARHLRARAALAPG